MKILLVRLSSMGDLIHTLPAVEDLRRFHPEAELHWLSEAGFADIARLHPFVAKVHEMRWRYWRKHLGEKQTFREIKELCEILRQEHYDFVLDSQGLLKSALFARMANAPIKGLDFNSARERWAALLYNQGFSVRKGENAVWRNRVLFAKVFGYNLPQQLSFGLQVPQAGCLNDLPSQYYVALHATSRDSKLWPQPHWLTLLKALHDESGCVIYLPWGNSAEKARAEAMAVELPFAVVCPKLNLLQAAWLLDKAEGVIGVDTGLLHLADALNKPVVGIYTDTDPHKTGVQPSPWACNLGGVGQIPNPDMVLQVLKNCVKAKHDAEIV
ncbi:lipopolysaccharide heptosyltransferase I [Neisseria sp. S1]|uniref:lipopolysaccharide heptosyltransferase I n=1 Tax=Neisseria sp. S1 TaxID=3318354 RepID=UPI003A875FCC